MGQLHRTQIYIEEDQFRQLQLKAKKERLDVSKLIRKAIDFFLNKEREISWDNDPFTKAIGKIKLNVTDASEKHDHYLYD